MDWNIGLPKTKPQLWLYGFDIPRTLSHAAVEWLVFMWSVTDKRLAFILMSTLAEQRTSRLSTPHLHICWWWAMVHKVTQRKSCNLHWLYWCNNHCQQCAIVDDDCNRCYGRGTLWHTVGIQIPPGTRVSGSFGQNTYIWECGQHSTGEIASTWCQTVSTIATCVWSQCCQTASQYQSGMYLYLLVSNYDSICSFQVADSHVTETAHSVVWERRRLSSAGQATESVNDSITAHYDIPWEFRKRQRNRRRPMSDIYDRVWESTSGCTITNNHDRQQFTQVSNRSTTKDSVNSYST